MLNFFQQDLNPAFHDRLALLRLLGQFLDPFQPLQLVLSDRFLSLLFTLQFLLPFGRFLLLDSLVFQFRFLEFRQPNFR